MLSLYGRTLQVKGRGDSIKNVKRCRIELYKLKRGWRTEDVAIVGCATLNKHTGKQCYLMQHIVTVYRTSVIDLETIAALSLKASSITMSP